MQYLRMDFRAFCLISLTLRILPYKIFFTLIIEINIRTPQFGGVLLSGNKKIPWIDTIRVLASLMIIVAHYFGCDGFSSQPGIVNRSLELAITGIFLFFALSGFLIKPSLTRSPSIWQFYKRKLIRIIVPFTVSYLTLSAAMSCLGIFNEQIAASVPLLQAIYGAKFFPILLGMFPVDLNVTKLLGLEVQLFVGEWFIGVLLWLYLLSPFLLKCAEKFPLPSQLISIGIASAAFYATSDLSAQGRLLGNWSLFIVRVPEFLFGMVLFVHREKFLRLRRFLLPGCALYLAAWAGIFISDFLPHVETFFPRDPSCFAVTLPTIYFLFTVIELLNEHGSKFLTWFNSLGEISYMAMLIQHVIIYRFAEAFDFGALHSFGRIYILLLITWVIILASRQLKNFSAPIESWFAKRG